MKSYRPLVLWILIIGIALALWNNAVLKNKEAAQKPGPNPQAQVSYVTTKKAQAGKKIEAVPKKVEKQPFVKETSKKSKSCLSEFAVISGYAQGNIREKDDYEIIPAMLRFGFDLKPANKKAMAQFAIEPFLNSVFSPNLNIETGANFMLRFGSRLIGRISLYVEGGLGFIYITQHTREQSTQYNFTPQTGGGLYFFLNKERSLALNVGYRYRHLSNGSLKQPNKGINTNMALIGISWFFN